MTSSTSSALLPSTTTTATAAAVPSPKSKATSSPCNVKNSTTSTSSKSSSRTESAPSTASTASTDGIPSRVVKISRNGKVVGSLKISDLHLGHQDKASSPSSSGSSGTCGHGGNGGNGGVTTSSSRLSCGLSDPCSDPIDGSSQSCQLTLDLDSAKLPYKKSLTNRSLHDSGDGRLNSQARHSEKGATPAVDDPSEKGTCLSSEASATAVQQQLRSRDGGGGKQIQRPRKSPAPSKTAKSTLTSCQHLNHHPQRPNHQQPSDLNDAFNPKSSKNDLVIGGLESHATEVVQVETTTTLPVDTTSCLSNIRSNIFKTTSKNRKNPVQPGFRGDRIVPSSLGMVGTVVSVTKGGQFI